MYFEKRNMYSSDWIQYHRRRKLSRAKPAAKRLTYELFSKVAVSGDYLVLLDGTFTTTGVAKEFSQASQNGLGVYTMIHDLIPLVTPELVPSPNRLTFHDWLLRTPDYTSHYLANSEASRTDLEQFLSVYAIKRSVSVIPLAQARLPSRLKKAAGPMRTRVNPSAYPELHEPEFYGKIEEIAPYPFVLCVGTIEARKNVWRLASAWDRLRRIEGLDLPKLVFAGRPGWSRLDFDNLLRATGNLGGLVEIIPSPSDTELDWLYRRCLFLAMPSLYEGWGLPVGEALSYGKTAVVSNVSSLPEVGGDLVEYCDPHSIDSIAEACLGLIRDPARRQALEERIKSAKLRSWSDVAADLLAVLKADQ